MISLEIFFKKVGVFLIVISIIFILDDVRILVIHWNEIFSAEYYKMLGSGIPSKNILLFDIFRWSLLIIGSCGFLNKTILGWIFPQAFLLCSFSVLVYSQIVFFRIHESFVYESVKLIIVNIVFMVATFKILNMIILKDYLSHNKMSSLFSWICIFTLNIIGLLIYNI
jgi:hypothetical protein